MTSSSDRTCRFVFCYLFSLQNRYNCSLFPSLPPFPLLPPFLPSDASITTNNIHENNRKLESTVPGEDSRYLLRTRAQPLCLGHLSSPHSNLYIPAEEDRSHTASNNSTRTEGERDDHILMLMCSTVKGCDPRPTNYK